MEEFKARSMRPNDWTHVQIERGRYFNKEHPITGYERADGQGGTPLHLVCIFEDRLQRTCKKLRETYQGISISRHHVKMPHWDQEDQNVPDNYLFVRTPERLTTTSVTVVLVPNDPSRKASMGFYFKGSELPSLRERMEQERKEGAHFQGLAGNLGYYVTESLIEGKLPWSHNARYPEFPLPAIRSYIGFHLFRDGTTGEIHSFFQGAHPAAVGILANGEVEIIPRLEIKKYRVTLWGQEFDVHSINSPDAIDKVS